MARPTKYRKSFIKEAANYLNECRNARKVPFLEEFAERIGTTDRTLRNWTEAHEEFLPAVEEIKDHQRLALKTLGLKSPSVIIFLLKADHGMIETEKIQHESSGTEPWNIIFTDVATWKRAEENRKRLEKLDNETVPIPEVQPGESSGGIGGYDSTNYSTRMNNLLTG